MVISRTPLHSEHTTAVDLAPGFRSRLGHIIVTGVHREPGRVTAALLTERGIPVIGVSGPGHPVTGSADLDVLEQLPSPVDPGYVPALARIAARYRAAMLIPSTREELCALSAGRAMIEHYGTQVLLAGPGAVMRTADRLHTLAHLESRGVPVPVFRTPGDLVSTAEALHLFGGAFLAVPRCPDGETTPLLVTSEEDLAWSSLDDTWVLQEVLLGEEYLALTHRPAKGNRDRRVGVVHERSRSVDPAFAPERGRGASAPPAMAVHAPDIEKLALAAVRALGLIGQAEVTIRLTRRGSPRVIDVSAAFGAHIRHTPEVLEALVGFAPEERVTSHLRSMRHIRGAG